MKHVWKTMADQLSGQGSEDLSPEEILLAAASAASSPRRWAPIMKMESQGRGEPVDNSPREDGPPMTEEEKRRYLEYVFSR